MKQKMNLKKHLVNVQIYIYVQKKVHFLDGLVMVKIGIKMKNYQQMMVLQNNGKILLVMY